MSRPKWLRADAGLGARNLVGGGSFIDASEPAGLYDTTREPLIPDAKRCAKNNNDGHRCGREKFFGEFCGYHRVDQQCIGVRMDGARCTVNVQGYGDYCKLHRSQRIRNESSTR